MSQPNLDALKNVIDKVVELVEKNSKLGVKVTVHHHLDDDCGFHSIDYVELGRDLEKEFSIKLIDVDIDEDKLETVKDIVKLVSTKLLEKDGVDFDNMDQPQPVDFDFMGELRSL